MISDMRIFKIILKTSIFLYLLYFGWQIWATQDFFQFSEVDYIKNANIIFHEAGHTLFIFFGDFLHTLGGSLLQIAILFLLALYFLLLRKEVFSTGVMLFWTAGSITDVGFYVADAQKTFIPLLGFPGGGAAGHDWHYLLGVMGVLDKTDMIAGVVFLFAGIFFVCAFLLLLYSLYLDFLKLDLNKKL